MQGETVSFRHIFYSDMSSTSDLLGSIDAGVDIGVVAGRIPGFAGLWSLMRHLDQGRAVFIDSGAFGERSSNIEPNWDDVFSVYEGLANLTEKSLSRLFVVAPDKVGDQAMSLVRLHRYRDRVKSLIDMGVRVIVPYQAGELGGAALHQAVKEILGCADFIVGVPSNRDAMPVEMLSTIVHGAYHILGRVQKNADQEARLNAITTASPSAILTSDAAWILSRMKRVCDATRTIQSARRNGLPVKAYDIESARRAAVRQVICQDDVWAAR